MAIVKKLITEIGVVLKKEYKKETQAFTGQDGRKVEAQPERWVITVASSSSIDKVEGLSDLTVLDYRVDKSVFDNVSYLDNVRVQYQFANNGSCKAEKLELI